MKSLRFTPIAAVRIITLFTFAVAHPLYDVLRREAHVPFLIAHEVRARDLYLLVAMFSIVIPSLLCVVIGLLAVVSEALARRVHGFVVVVLFLALCGPIPDKLFGDPGWPGTALGLAAGLLAAFLFVTRKPVRQAVSLMSALVVLSPLLLLTSAPVTAYLASRERPRIEADATGENRVNVVLVVFDQIPATSLLDGRQRPDDVVFPNFARLAATSTWYANAVAVYTNTHLAIPSLLTGSLLERYRQRLSLDAPDRQRSREADRELYPQNLLLHLARTHDVLAVESTTQMAPARDTEELPPVRRRVPVSLFLVDSAVVAGHIVLPGSERVLPSVTQQWTGFAGEPGNVPTTPDWPYEGLRPQKVREFIDLLGRGKDPAFYFLHVVLPHVPFEYDEEGKVDSTGGRIPFHTIKNRTGVNIWGSEELNTAAYQAHLLQLAFVDRLLGRILDRLREVGLFDESLVVVTADHGISFYWDDETLPLDQVRSIRRIELEQVPLLIKQPHQTEARVSDDLVLAIDLAPTIADLTGTPLSWPVDGYSVFDANRPARNRSDYGPGTAHPVPVSRQLDRIIRGKVDRFGSHSLESIYYYGPHRELGDQPVSRFTIMETAARGEIGRTVYENVDPAGSALPAVLRGTVRGSGEVEVAIAINDTIRGTARVILQKGQGAFFIRVPPWSWKAGKNSVSLYAIQTDQAGGVAALGRLVE